MDVKWCVILLLLCGTVTAVLSLWQPEGYLGCYADSVEVLFEYKESFFFNTGEKCMNLCLMRNFTYAGTKYYACHCGNTIEGTPVSTGCSYVCPGNMSQNCGGLGTLSLYMTGFSVSEDPVFGYPPADYIGPTSTGTTSTSVTDTTTVNPSTTSAYSLMTTSPNLKSVSSLTSNKPTNVSVSEDPVLGYPPADYIGPTSTGTTSTSVTDTTTVNPSTTSAYSPMTSSPSLKSVSSLTSNKPTNGPAAGSKWKSWSGSRIFYMARNVNFEFSQCQDFCEQSVKSSLAVFWDTINPWFEESGILQHEKRYWVQKEETMSHGTQCNYLSAQGYPRGLHCTEIYKDDSDCEKETSYKLLVLNSSPCEEKYGCICERRI